MAAQAKRKNRKGSPVVYQLIQKMTSDEKRHFKLYAQKYDNTDNLCLTLFDAINTALRKGKPVDDALIKQQIKGQPVARYFVSAKNKLKNLLYDSLYDMHGRNTDEYQIIKQYRVADILRDKGLQAEAQKQLQNTMKAALQKEYYTLWLDGFRYKVNYSIEDMTTPLATLHEWMDEAAEVNNLLANYTQRVLLNRLIYTAYITGEDKIDNKTRRVFNKEYLQELVQQSRSAYGKYLALNCLLFYVARYKTSNESVAIAQQQKDVLQQTLEYTRRYAGEFFVAYQNYLNTLHPTEHLKQIVEGSKEMEALAQKHLRYAGDKRISATAVYHATMTRLNAYIENNDLAAISKEVVHAVEVYKKEGVGIGVPGQVVFLSLIKDSYFILGKHNEALKWVKQIKEVIPAGLLHHYRLCNLFTELMLLIETKATARALRNSEENLRITIARCNYSAEQQLLLLALLKLIAAVAVVRNHKEQQQALQQLAAFAEEIKKSQDRAIRALVSESNVRQWVARKLK